MKNAYRLLQAHALLIAVFLLVHRQILNLLASKSGTVAGYFLFLVAGLSLVVFLMCFWYFKAKWQLDHRGYMFALLFASVNGLMVSVSGIMYAIWPGTVWFHGLMVQCSIIPLFLSLVGFYLEWTSDDTTRHQKKGG